MARNSRRSVADLLAQRGATALLTATFTFLRGNNISNEWILKSFTRKFEPRKTKAADRKYKKLLRAYEDMGMIMATWFSLPQFLDSKSRPIPLVAGHAPKSISNLIRLSRVRISVAGAMELMRQSPSIRVDADGQFVALKRVFVLSEFEVPRAALVIERYLDTLRKNSSAQKKQRTLLLERNCHVPEMDLKKIAPILRDIRDRGTAFMDSVDGDIEANRLRRSKPKRVGDLGVLIFAWTRPSRR